MDYKFKVGDIIIDNIGNIDKVEQVFEVDPDENPRYNKYFISVTIHSVDDRIPLAHITEWGIDELQHYCPKLHNEYKKNIALKEEIETWLK